MIAGAVCFAAANAAVLAGTRALFSGVRTGRGEVDALLFLLIRILLISVLVLVAGVTWLIGPWGLLGLSISAALIATFAVAPRVPANADVAPAFRVDGVWSRFGPILIVAAAIVALKLLTQVWIFAPYAGDALSYHLPKIAEWVRAGHFTVEMGPDNHAAFPAGFELIETWWVAFFHHDALIEMGGVEMLVVACAAVYALAKHLRLSDRWSFFAALAFAMVPGLNLQATSCLNDLAMVALFVSAAALIVHDAPAAVIVIPLALGAGVKGTFLYSLPGLAALWLLERRARPARSVHVRGVRRAAMRLAVLALIPGAFWYARNTLWFGNPIYPMGAGGVQEASGYVDVRFGMSVPGWFQNFSDLIESRMSDREAAYTALSTHVSGWGALAFACGVPAMFVMLRRDDSYRRLTLAFLVGLTSVLLLVQHDDWYARFVLFFPAVLVMPFAMAAAELPALLVVGIPALLLQAASTLVPGELTAAQIADLARQPWRERSTAAFYGADLEGADPIAFYSDYYNDSYLLFRPDFSRSVIFIHGTTADALAGEIKAARADTLFAAPGTPARQRVFDNVVARGILRPLKGRFFWTVVR